jgi:hypothetical protein
MNSYGSVSLVSQAIYRVIRYMNWMNDDPREVVVTATDAATAADADHNS